MTSKELTELAKVVRTRLREEFPDAIKKVDKWYSTCGSLMLRTKLHDRISVLFPVIPSSNSDEIFIVDYRAAVIEVQFCDIKVADDLLDKFYSLDKLAWNRTEKSKSK